jgi:formylglycine-generating enzyme required for sulfatase activity
MPGKKTPVRGEIQENPGSVQEDRVRLKPILGIRPGVYLAFLYSLILGVILFFVFLYPGLSNPGSLIRVNSEPRGAAFRVDGIYRDTVPCSVFVPRGKRVIEVLLPGFTPRRIEVDVPGRVLGSLFFPRKLNLDITLETPDPLAALAGEAAEFAAWSFAGEATADYQIPPSLSEGVYRVGPALASPELAREAGEMAAASVRFAASRSGLRDVVRAKFLVESRGLSPSPLNVSAALGEILAYLGDTPGTAAWLADTLQGEAVSELAATPWYAADTAWAEALIEKAGTQSPAPAGYAEIPGSPSSQRYWEIPPGLLIQGGVFPRLVEVKGFFMAESGISLAAWEEFLEENPQWRAENTDSLAAQGLVTEDYLNPGEFSPPRGPEDIPGVPGISWYAARAWCRWASSRQPGNWPWEYRLPTEAEWEYAAKILEKSGGEYSILYRRWEWCEDPFVPLNFLPAPAGAAAAVCSPERNLRGGSWINPPGSLGPETRASLPPSSCSPFVSFRPIVAPREER